jgi:hypothetical protein
MVMAIMAITGIMATMATMATINNMVMVKGREAMLRIMNFWHWYPGV